MFLLGSIDFSIMDNASRSCNYCGEIEPDYLIKDIIVTKIIFLNDLSHFIPCILAEFLCHKYFIMTRFTPVQDIMTEKVIFARTKNKISEIEEFFLKYNVHHIPVLDESDHLVGMLSSTDLVKIYKEAMKSHAFMSKEDIDHLYPISSVMSKNPVTVTPSETVHSAVKKMNENKIQALPVIQDQGLKGILTSRDMIKFIFE